MEKTGHHSLEGVHSYKRTNSEQRENLSDILSLNIKSHVECGSPSIAQLHSSDMQLSPIYRVRFVVGLG